MKKSADRHRTWKLAAAASAALALTLSGCTVATKNSETTASIDAPPASVEAQMLQASNGEAAMAAVSAEDGLTVYLKDRNGYVAPMTLSKKPEQAEKEIAPETAALSWLIADPKLASQLPPGFTPLWPQGTKFRSVIKNVESGVVTVDFAAPLPVMPASQERKALESLVWTLTELPGIDKVHLEAAGKPLTQLPASGLPVADVLTRKIGINLEQSPGVKPSETMAVTLYFSSKTAEGDGYFVPVTRLIGRENDKARAALAELIKGPSDKSKLEPVLVDGTTVESLDQDANTINVKLKEKGWTPKLAVPQAMMQGLVLTLTEATGVPQVQLAMNGDIKLSDTDNQSYEQPVSRPKRINAYQG